MDFFLTLAGRRKWQYEPRDGRWIARRWTGTAWEERELTEAEYQDAIAAWSIR